MSKFGINKMINRELFERIKARHGGYASWAVWAEAAESPKSNIGDLAALNPDLNPSLLSVLRNDVVMVGLNISRALPEPFRNFHDPSASANDFKIRYAFTGTDYYGAYMTDIIKNFEMVKSSDVLKQLTPTLRKESSQAFLAELADLGAAKPTVLVFGTAAYKLVKALVPAQAYSRLVKVTHYSHYIGKERYRDDVFAELHGLVQKA